jgi:hypothetical protein
MLFMSEEKRESNTIDAALTSCEGNITSHRNSATKALTYAIALPFFVVLIVWIYYQFQARYAVDNFHKLVDSYTESSLDMARLGDRINTRENELIFVVRSMLESVNQDDRKALFQDFPGLLQAYDGETLWKLESISRRVTNQLAGIYERGNYDADTLSVMLRNRRVDKYEIRPEDVLGERNFLELEELKRDYESRNIALATSRDKVLVASLTPQIFRQESLYILGVLITLLISIFISLHRFHIKEISRLEQYSLGFSRIRIAANNASSVGFSSEVRDALTVGAFDFQKESVLPKRGKQIESPLDGNPTSDLATVIINKLLESLDVSVKQKDKSQN